MDIELHGHGMITKEMGTAPKEIYGMLTGEIQAYINTRGE